MKNYKSSLTNVTLATLGAAVFAVTVEAGAPSPQTPYLVPKSKQGVVEVGPCQMPPCVGGRAVTPNARDYGYYEGTWRQWPTQQRYDQKFPQALNTSPIRKQGNANATPANSVISPDPSTSAITAPIPAVNTIIMPDDPEPTPLMENITDSTLSVPSDVVTPQATPKMAPPLVEPVPRQVDPIEEDDAFLTPPAPSLDSPLMDSEEPISSAREIDDSLPIPVSKQAPNGERSIIVSQNENSMNTQRSLPSLSSPNDPYIALIEDKGTPETRNIPIENSYDMVAVQVSHVENATGSKINPFNTAVVPNGVPVSSENVTAEHAQTVADVIIKTPEIIGSTEDYALNAENNSESRVGLDGFCPVTLQETESWTEGVAKWSVIHHGITYHLASSEQVQKFLANPEKYTPAMDGADPVLFAETGVRKIGTVDNCVVFEGQLFMFVNERNLNKFFENTSAYMK